MILWNLKKTTRKKNNSGKEKSKMGMSNSNKREREELHRAIWSIANDLRGSVDGWDFKQYVLGMLFYRYISENITEYINTNEKEAGNEDFDYAAIDDDMAISIRQEIVESKGFLFYQVNFLKIYTNKLPSKRI